MSFALFNTFAGFGDLVKFNIRLNTKEVINKLRDFEEDWTPHNPVLQAKHNNNRHALSIINLDGKVGPGPDLDNLWQYNERNNVILKERDFKVHTPVYDIFAEYLDPIKHLLIRSHILQLRSGGYFPSHRDMKTADIKSFRIFIPLENCNPPTAYVLMEDRILHFEHGHLYFLNTCKQHTIFNSSTMNMTFVVLNVLLNEESTNYFLSAEVLSG
jgi:hypothetical protein